MAARKAAKQRTVATLGEHGRTVRVFRQGNLWRVQSRSLGITQSFRGEGARDRAMGFAERLVAGEAATARRNPTIGELWDRYRESSAFRELRPRTRELTPELWAYFTEVVPAHTRADDVTVMVLDQARYALETTPRPRAPEGLAISTVSRVVSRVKTVFAWAERYELIHRNRIASYVFRVAKERRTESPPEYTQEEVAKLLGALSFDVIGERTAYCLLVVLAHQGTRVGATCQLEWSHVDFDAEAEIAGRTVQCGALRWVAETDKMGNAWVQPMRAATRAVLARLHAAQGYPTTGYVFPARQKRSKTPYYSPNSFWLMLTKAERRAGVAHRARRGAHGLRRGLAGNLVEATGSEWLAMEAIGDKDPKQARKYVKLRLGRVAESLLSLDLAEQESAANQQPNSNIERMAG